MRAASAGARGAGRGAPRDFGALHARARLDAAATTDAEARAEVRKGPVPSTGAPPDAAPPRASVLERAALSVDILALRDRAGVELRFGPELAVRVESRDGGVALAVRAPERIAALARAELPALAAAVRARGVAVTGAAVEPRGRPNGRGTCSR